VINSEPADALAVAAIASESTATATVLPRIRFITKNSPFFGLRMRPKSPLPDSAGGANRALWVNGTTLITYARLVLAVVLASLPRTFDCGAAQPDVQYISCGT
jgi:hypothetical protein